MKKTLHDCVHPESRPRERLLKYGSRSLANHELLAILLRTGTRGKNVLDVAQEVLRHYEHLYELRQVTFEEWTSYSGIGPAKAIELLAAIELGKRIFKSHQLTKGQVVSSVWAGNYLVEEMKGLEQEHVLALYLDTKNKIIKEDMLFIGSVNASVAHPREIFKGAVRSNASRVILAHNHPSGHPEPSQADIDFTRRVAKAGVMMGIELLDHFVVGEGEYVSMKESGVF